MIRPGKRLELLFWSMLPGVIALLLTLACLAPRHVGDLKSFMPLLPIIPIFYWGMQHAREMPYWFVFSLGLVMDAATGMPLGFYALSFIVFLALLHAQRRFIHKEGFVIKWAHFAALLLAVSCLQWLAMSLLSGMPQALAPALIQWILTVGCYPLLHKCFDAIARMAQDRRWRALHSH